MEPKLEDNCQYWKDTAFAYLQRIVELKDNIRSLEEEIRTKYLRRIEDLDYQLRTCRSQAEITQHIVEEYAHAY